MSGKNKKCLDGLFIRIAIYINHIQAIGYNVWWNCLKLSDKMYLTMRMRLFSKGKYRHAVCLKLGA